MGITILYGHSQELNTGHLGIEAENVVVIEDNPSGVRSANDAGCKVIGFPNRFTIGMDFSLADRVVSSLDEISDEFLQEMYSG